MKIHDRFSELGWDLKNTRKINYQLVLFDIHGQDRYVPARASILARTGINGLFSG
ncbi:hypothetical protein [Desulfonatronovibrio hydrogenovorans]|uniref:hypothetical protein n=1 Tax=Desulfonatronovibrio hydrogenovorans TaxID=53245 RepID=UPI00129476C1|nr:hypothetical protein [Desulfonatronovibrio hydrogenovorans]